MFGENIKVEAPRSKKRNPGNNILKHKGEKAILTSPLYYDVTFRSAYTSPEAIFFTGRNIFARAACLVIPKLSTDATANLWYSSGLYATR